MNTPDMGKHDGDEYGGSARAGRHTPPTQAQAAASVLRTSLDSLITESQALRSDVKAAEAQRFRESTRRRQENLVMFGLLGVLSLLMLLMLTVAWQNNELAQDVRASSDQLADCTTPGGKCYAQSQARTGQAVQNIQRIQIYIVQCARALPAEQYPEGPTFDRAFEKCVADRLTKPPYPNLPPRPTATPTPGER